MKMSQIHQTDLVVVVVDTVRAPRDDPSDVIYDPLPGLCMAARLLWQRAGVLLYHRAQDQQGSPFFKDKSCNYVWDQCGPFLICCALLILLIRKKKSWNCFVMLCQIEIFSRWQCFGEQSQVDFKCLQLIFFLKYVTRWSLFAPLLELWLILLAMLCSKVCNNHTNSVLGFPAVCVTALLVSTSDTLILGIVSFQPWRAVTQQ